MTHVTDTDQIQAAAFRSIAKDYESARYFVILAVLSEIMAMLYEMEANNK